MTMKHLTIVALTAYAVMIGAPRNLHEAATLAMRTGVLLIQLGLSLDDRGYDAGYDAGFDPEPYEPQQEANCCSLEGVTS